MKRIYLIFTIIFLSSCAAKKETPAPEVNCWGYVSKAIELRKQKDFQGSLRQIELHGLCDKSEVRMSYYYHLGWTYYEMNEYSKAVDAFTEGLKTEPQYVYAYWRRGLAYEKLGEFAKAEADYKQAYEIGMSKDPDKFLEVLEKNPDVKEKLKKY